ncbi:MAG: metallophosphoesterase [Gemmobacter sp.]
MTRIALIADPHVHDCGWSPSGSGLRHAVRSYAETSASTRVFNESMPAFRAALDRAAREDARLVLLLGDLTDDGQEPNIRAALALLDEYRTGYGMRFLATPGNHDFFASAGRPQTKCFLDAMGGAVPVDSATSAEAATLGAEPALRLMDGLGYLPADGDLHWETPFGTDTDWSVRTHDVVSADGRSSWPMIDASYLVEPVAGLWVLSLDANICVPRDGARDFADPASFHDPSNTGWSAVLHHRPHLLRWMTDVADRARKGGKRLIAFSHYPVLDPLGGASADEVAIFGATGLARRAPPPEVAQAFAATGVRVHFSGHMHVNDTAQDQSGLVNIAVPSPVGFPPALKLLDADTCGMTFRTLPLTEVPGHDRAFGAYRAEAMCEGRQPPAASRATDHAAFLDHHLADIVMGRYLPREWPEEMAAFVRQGRLADLAVLLGHSPDAAPDGSMSDFACDWYRLRKGGEMALPYIAVPRLAFYRMLMTRLPNAAPNGLAGGFAALLRILHAYIDRLPNRDFRLDDNLGVTALQGRTVRRQTT